MESTDSASSKGMDKVVSVSILWFRHGLRLHDNPAFVAATSNREHLFLPIFIFDGESAGTKIVGYNRMRFLIESLEDLSNAFSTKYEGSLTILRGQPVELFKKLSQRWKITKICFEQDCEPIWKERDDGVKEFCKENGIEVVECISHTLYDPAEILSANGGNPPYTYGSFMFVASTLGKPERPLSAPNTEPEKINFLKMTGDDDDPALCQLHFPMTPEVFGISKEKAVGENMRKGGETEGIILLEKRLAIEKQAFEQGLMLPNHTNPDFINGASLSPHLRFGCVSVRSFYWAVQDLFSAIVGGNTTCETITGQLFWREYFYVMSVPNPSFDKMKSNPICLNIPWAKDVIAKENLKKWKAGKTGYPFIDAAMRQLLEQGWLHHVARNASACFLTRNDLWISWEKGLKHFLKYLLDADWSVCAGNWLWVSSSAFENVLDCTLCICPTRYAQRLDPEATFIKRFIPELQNYTIPYVFEPWTAPLELQTQWGCLIGKDYPAPIVNHEIVSKRNKAEMISLQRMLAGGGSNEHPCPSNTNEARNFMWFPDICAHDESH
ncbi:unnamed protein product [Orchesella dallaii]|uniref:Cryptochrome-1 n=1 Tax=Orchesella dallaii TaxID=48710 RepID=A0ABP1PRI2_9HEXA